MKKVMSPRAVGLENVNRLCQLLLKSNWNESRTIVLANVQGFYAINRISNSKKVETQQRSLIFRYFGLGILRGHSLSSKTFRFFKSDSTVPEIEIGRPDRDWRSGK